MDGENRSFRVSGAVKDGNLVMYDEETGSLWLQRTGESLEGPMKGTALRELPESQVNQRVRWDEWKRLHPHTLVLVAEFRNTDAP